jgi:DNA-binding NarL/FixJ family response regulator
MSIKVGIVEDNAGVRKNLVKLIDAERGFKCVGACDCGEAALELFSEEPPDVVLMDLRLPGMSGIECTARLKAKLPDTQILMVTVYADNEHVFEALKVGATGYLLKCADPADLTRAITEVMHGGAPMTGEIARRVVQAFRRKAPAATADTLLTPREDEILGLLAKGYANKEIASRLGTSVETVRVHVRHIYEKLRVRSRTEAAVKYLIGADSGPVPIAPAA